MKPMNIINEDDPFGQPFNFSDFKKWMQHHPDTKKSNLIGVQVESKINYKKLLSRIQETKDGLLEDVAKEFSKNGGIIMEVDGHDVVIKVDNGSFIIHKMNIKKSD